MAIEKISLKNFIVDETLLEKKKRKKHRKKSRKPAGIRKGSGGLANDWYSGGHGDGGGSGMGESLIYELFAGMQPSGMSGTVNTAVAVNKSYKDEDKDPGMTTYPSENPEAWNEEEPEMQATKVDQARQVFQRLINQPNIKRADIINAFMQDIGVTNSTGVSYYTRFLDEFGLNSKDIENNLGQGTGMGAADDDTTGGKSGEEAFTAPPGEAPDLEEPENSQRAGIIRTVANAHLVYKRQTEDGTFHELWIYNLHDSTHDELEIRRDILAGTDIPINKTFSADGTQKYTIATMGNAQLINILGLTN